MQFSRVQRRVAALIAGSLLVTPALAVAYPAAQAVAPAPAHDVEFDYLGDVFDALQPGQHVFESVTIERLKYLIRFQGGTFPILIGDPTDEHTQATIGHINAVAQAQGIDKIYFFNPRIDGGKLNIFDHNEIAEILGGDGLAYWQAEGDPLDATVTGGPLRELIKDKDADQRFAIAGGVTTGPYLFSLNPTRMSGGDDDQVISALTERKTAADLSTPAAIEAYEAEVAAMLAAVPAEQYTDNTQFDFYRDEVNRRHLVDFVAPDEDPDSAEKYGTEIITDLDDSEGWRLVNLTYPETVHLLSAYSGDIPLLFGGTWSDHTRAILKDVNRIAQERGISHVYNLDFSLFSVGDEDTDFDNIRPTKAIGSATVGEGALKRITTPAHLYGDLIAEYLRNAVAEYANEAEPNENPTAYYPAGNPNNTVQYTRRLQSGHLLSYNKDHLDALGNPAPVVDQAIRYNDPGVDGQLTYAEYATQWWFVAGRDLPGDDPALRGNFPVGSANLQNARNFAHEAIDEISAVLEGVGDVRYLSTVSVAAADLSPGAALPIDTASTITVQVSADEWAPFVSFNNSGADPVGSDAPAVGTGKPRGWVSVVDQTGQVIAGPVNLNRNADPITFQIAAEQALPGATFRAVYSGRGTVIAPSEAAIAVATLPSTTTLTGPSSLTYGTGGVLTTTATASEPNIADATGIARLTGFSGGALTTRVIDGTVRWQVPAKIPAGTYTLRARYLGEGPLSASDSQPLSLTIKQAAAKPTVEVTRTSAYGRSAVVTVSITTANGIPATGRVSIAGAGATKRAKLSAKGRATFTLPKTLRPKSYTVRATYEGDRNIRQVSKAAKLKITKATAGRPKIKIRRAPRVKRAGLATVTVPTGKGLAKAAGLVVVTFKRGTQAKRAYATVRAGKATMTLPALAKGTWKVTAKFSRSVNYKVATSKTIKVRAR